MEEKEENVGIDHKDEWEIIGGKYVTLSKTPNDIYDIRAESCGSLLDQYC